MDIRFLGGLACLFASQAAGDFVARITGGPLPGQLIGVAFAFGLTFTPAREALQIAARPLLGILPLLLIPLGVGVINQASVLDREGTRFAVVATSVTILTLFVSRRVFDWTLRLAGKRYD